MAEFKLVLSRKDGKSSQKIIKDKEAQALLKKRIGEKVSGNDIGMEGYEFEITGGSDKCGFPMRKGILLKRQKIMIKGKGVGFSGKNRNKKKQKGLKRKKTVCGEMIDSGIVQVNLKVLKEGKEKLGEDKEEKLKEEEKPVEEKKEEVKEEPKDEQSSSESQQTETKEKDKLVEEEEVEK